MSVTPINFYLSFFSFLVAIVCSCSASKEVGSEQPTTVQEVLTHHLNALYRTTNFAEAYTDISVQDQKVKSLALYKQELQASRLGQRLKGQIHFRVQNIQQKPAKAQATIELTYPAIDQMVKQLLTAKEKGDTSLKAELDLQFQTQIPMVKEKESLHLIREDGRWKVFYNWQKHALENTSRVKFGEQAKILDHPQEGFVALTLREVRFAPSTQRSQQRFCIVDIELYSGLKRKKFEQLSWLVTVNPQLVDAKNKHYPVNFDLIPVLDDTPYTQPFMRHTEPLLPSSSSRGELLFLIDQEAKDLTLELDATWQSQAGQKVIFEFPKENKIIRSPALTE